MTSQPRRRLIFSWTAPKNLLAILLFIALAILSEYIIISAIPINTSDPTAISLPAINITISPLYHLLPIAVIITLTASFIHLTTQIAMVPKRIQTSKKPLPRTTRQKSTRLKPLQNLYKKLQRAARKVRDKILKTPTIAQIQHRIVLAKALIKSATTVIVIFIIIIILITLTAYPRLVSTITFDFYRWNTVFFNFVTATIEASEAIANAIPPIGVLATAIQNALNTAAPGFRNTLEGAASAITNGIVSLDSTGKYLVIQNAAAWTVAVITLLYSQYAKTRRYRR